MNRAATTTRAVLAFAASLAMGGGALAQGLPGGATSLNETHGDWTVICAAADGAVDCSAAQSQVNAQSRQRVLTLELTLASDGAAAGLLVVPFGLRLESGISMAVDDNAPLPRASFSTCMPVGCLVPVTFGAEALSFLREGQALLIRGVAHDTGQEVRFSVSLTGLASALDRTLALVTP